MVTQATTSGTSGKLRLTIVEAKLTRDTEFFGKMDPFVIVEYRQQKFKTVTKQNAGKLPKWEQTYDLDIKYIGDDIFVKVFDEDVTDNDAVGATMIKASALCVPQGIDEWFRITYKGKSAGEIRLRAAWTPTSSGAPNMASM